MKTIITSILFCLLVSPATAQFTLSASPQVGYNFSKTYFSDFRNTYNTSFASTLDKGLGNPSLMRGYSMVLGFRIMRLASSLGRDYMWASTHSLFPNGGKRRIDYTYKMTMINVGYFQPDNGSGEFTLEVGMVHAVANQYSYVILPTGEKDFAGGGLNVQNNWSNLGMDLRLMYEIPITDMLFFHIQATGIFLNNDKEFAPAIELNGTRATTTLKGLQAGAGLSLQLGEIID